MNLDLARIRKALWAAVLAGAFAVPGAPGVDAADGVDVTDVAAGAAAFVAAAIVAGFAVYRVRNSGTVNGSDPRPGGVPAGGR